MLRGWACSTCGVFSVKAGTFIITGMEPGLIGLATMEADFSVLMGGRKVDLRTLHEYRVRLREAAARMSDATRANAPDIPWSAMVGMRNRLVHAYFDVDTDLVWKTTQAEPPALKARLQNLI
jgi:hypothetical protein